MLKRLINLILRGLQTEVVCADVAVAKNDCVVQADPCRTRLVGSHAFPRTYGDVMRPLDVEQLSEPLLTQYRTIPRVREWLRLADRVRRAEKISSWAQWTPEETAAYEVEDYWTFSQLRGYSEAEIEEFEQFVQFALQLDREMSSHGEIEFCANALGEIHQLVRTPAFDEVEAELVRMSDAALAEEAARARTDGLAFIERGRSMNWPQPVNSI